MMALTNTVTESLVQDIGATNFLSPLDRLGIDLTLSLTLPLIDNNFVDILIVVIVLGFFAGVKKNLDLLLHLVAGNTVGVQDLVEVGDSEPLDVEVGPSPAILDALDSGGHTAQYPHLVSGEIKLLALEICHLQTQRLY